ncbi:hypothetical protein Heshes_04160 [Alicyclobacillus hesperidum]|uniref:Uncharacterized protein n=1 Tax=Alicyclobacillus hesperidum TaxID=89784 RepID=A0A1H2QA58_9BACL|nr:hypothetical protein [Alicyclobacillus hesperidum]GLV12732.1 hypothetical protein Heshes_04160 [Alicyclobacillus hesperidum]SDW04041.1 hypothetical protein SAMN04489725_101167 [Alicyclobacillus hesperidum]
MTNSKTVCRLIGWTCTTLGALGIAYGQLGSYLRFSDLESYTYLVFGLISIWAARRRQRTAVAVLFTVGMACFLWAALALAAPTNAWAPYFGEQQPLDVLIREMIALWGGGTALREILDWRRQQTSSAS